jgi:trans-2,3-dihydro-3-hydroxyanthranilate isomerase
MNDLNYYVTDVFTNTAFGGNPLAVFLDADSLSTQQMLCIAKEMNLSETVFVCEAKDPQAWAKLRIFTTEEELPFAGHPNVGTAATLVHAGRYPKALIEKEAAFESYFEEGVGKVGIRVLLEESKPTVAELTAAVPAHIELAPHQHQRYGMILGLKEQDFHGSIPVYLAEAGLAFGIVVASSKESVQGAQMNTAGWQQWLKDTSAKFTYLVYIDSHRKELYARMFCPSLGVVEDPATGSAAAALSGVLAKHFCEDDSEEQHWLIHQGVDIGRPSKIDLRFMVEKGKAHQICVGGPSVVIAEGRMRVPVL